MSAQVRDIGIQAVPAPATGIPQTVIQAAKKQVPIRVFQVLFPKLLTINILIQVWSLVEAVIAQQAQLEKAAR